MKVDPGDEFSAALWLSGGISAALMLSWLLHELLRKEDTTCQ